MTLRALGHCVNVREDLELAAELPENSLRLLLRAAHYAIGTRRSPAEFAVPGGELRATGLAKCDLRWLILQGYLVQSPPVAADRNCDEVASWNDHSLFVLTPSGTKLVERALDRFASPANRLTGLVTTPHRIGSSAAAVVPCWDLQRRELSVGQILIKRFNAPAENQEIILSSFQEEAWPEHLLDPLPPAPGMDAKRRLHSTIQCLNRNQKAPLLRFHGDGYGRGIRWELLSA